MPMPDNQAIHCGVAVIGGGSAGLMAAIAAAQSWLSHKAAAGEDRFETACPVPVVLLEKQERVGRKLLVTGNGRCNLSNRNVSSAHYHGSEARFVKGALNRLPVEETLDLFRNLGLLCRTLPDGRIYPYSYQASAVLDLLRAAAAHLGVHPETSFAAIKLASVGNLCSGSHTLFRITAADGREIIARRVILATGGMAAPALGCDGGGYHLMQKFGHRLTKIFPALVQIRTETEFVHGLSGIKFDGLAAVEVDGKILKKAAGEILFTEYGLSGPPILELSRTVGEILQGTGKKVQILLDLLPEMSETELLQWLWFRQANCLSAELTEYLTGLVNKKIGLAVLKRCLDRSLSKLAAGLTDAERQKIAFWLKHLSIRAVGTQDWSQAQVTAGGLDVRDFWPDSLESRLVPGLYAAGEILDIDGDCGGFNLQWAWSSGYLAGRRAADVIWSEKT